MTSAFIVNVIFTTTNKLKVLLWNIGYKIQSKEIYYKLLQWHLQMEIVHVTKVANTNEF